MHIIDNSEFKSLPKWGFENTQMHAAYYRIKIAQFLPKSIDKCLYLDTDMLVLCDLRELFVVDINPYVIASSSGLPSVDDLCKVYLRPSGGGKKVLAFETKFYFCSGLMLIDVKKWREQNIQSHSLDFFTRFQSRYADQDALNFALIDKAKDIGSQWGVVLHAYVNARCEKGKEGYVKACEELIKSAKILHGTAHTKPWFGVSKYLRSLTIPIVYPHKEKWLEMAKLCKEFEYDLAQTIHELESDTLEQYAFNLSQELRSYTFMVTFKRWKKRLSYLKTPRVFIHKALSMLQRNLVR